MGFILLLRQLEGALKAWFQGREEGERTESYRDVKLYVFVHLFQKGKKEENCAMKMRKKDAAAGAQFLKRVLCVCVL